MSKHEQRVKRPKQVNPKLKLVSAQDQYQNNVEKVISPERIQTDYESNRRGNVQEPITVKFSRILRAIVRIQRAFRAKRMRKLIQKDLEGMFEVPIDLRAIDGDEKKN